jgi:Flp pilus assembly protein protease CpaA
MHPSMMNFPPSGPLATAGAPLASTIVVVGAPAVMALVLALAVLAGVLCVAALRGRRVRRRVVARPRAQAPQVAMPFAAGGSR